MAWGYLEILELQVLLSRGMYQSEIAKQLGVSQQVISYQVGKLRKRYGLK
tara:strand:+ start:339 stop:488 length:150 start_codon:yes stop_codon:yes gene_type:complete